MVRVLDDIWIMRKEGTVLFTYVAEERLNEQIFGSVLSAIDAFADKIDKGGLTSFQIGPKKYIIKKAQNLYFIANHDAKRNSKKAAAELTFLSNMFCDVYHAELSTFYGNVKPFQDFDKKVHESKMENYWMLI